MIRRLALSVLLLGVVAVWGWTFVVVKDAVAIYGVAPFLAVRFLIGAACIAPFCAHRLDRRTLRCGGLIGLVVGAAFLLQTLGLERSTATNTGLVTGMFVVAAPVANRLLFGVRTRWVLWAAIGVSLVGLGLLTGGAPRGIAAGDWITLRAAVLFGLHVALLDRYSKHHHATVLAFGQLLGAALLLSAFWLLLAALGPSVAPFQWPSPAVWRALLITAVLATAVAFFVQTFVQKRLSAVETAMIIVLEPIFAAAFGYLLHGDRLTAVQLTGAVLMVAAVVVAELYPLLRKNSPRHAPHG